MKCNPEITAIDISDRDMKFLEKYFSFEYDIMMPSIENSPKILWNLVDLELWGRLCIQQESPYYLIDLIRSKGIECSDYIDG